MQTQIAQHFRYAAVFGALCWSAHPAFAIQLQQRGDAIILTGQIHYGDDSYFDRFMARPEAASARTIWFNSPGGKVDVAANIARRIRAARLTTVLNGHRHCGSACTQLFVAGVRRHYFNAPPQDRMGGPRISLGFHEASAPHRMEIMISSYREMGVPRAATMALRAPRTTMFFLSGQTALRSGIATSLNRP